MADEPLLHAEGLTVRFGGHVAVADVDLAVPAGRITGLIGPNGAGKTTTFNALCGLQPLTRGRVTFDGEDVTKLSPHKRARRGLARTFQRLETFQLLTVRENILAGAEFRLRSARGPASPHAIADDLIARLALGDVADERVDALPTGRARLVEVGRALANQPRVLLLDEPSSGLNEAETAELAVVLGELAGDGLGVLLVEHDMSLVMGSCEHIFVLDFGQLIASGTPAEVQADEHVRTAYLGDAPDEEAREAAVARTAPGPSTPVAPRATTGEPPVLAVHGLAAGYGDFDVIEDVDLEVASGQVFALLGPNGAGKTTLLKVISGLVGASRGSVELCGRPVLGATADALARAGLCTVPEGRGVFPNLTVTENLEMASFGRRSRREVEEVAFARFPRLAERRSQVAGTMSGGEQQMLAMARALATDPALLILDELSMGLAPIVVHELYEQVAAIAAEGLSILVVEQFAHEVLGVADVAAIMLHGRLAASGTPQEIAAALETAYLAGSTGTA